MDKDKFKEEVLSVFKCADFESDYSAIVRFGTSYISITTFHDDFNALFMSLNPMTFSARGIHAELKTAINAAMKDARAKCNLALEKFETMIKSGE